MTPSTMGTVPDGTIVTFTAVVKAPSGSNVSPTGTVQFYSNGDTLGPNYGSPVPLTPGSGGTSTAIFTAPVYTTFGGTEQLYATYSGDAIYTLSTSNTIQFTNDESDFSIQTTTPIVTILTGQAASAQVVLTAIDQFSGNITLSCSVSGGPAGNKFLPSCSVANTVAVTPVGQVMATVQIGTIATIAQNVHSGYWPAGGVALACMVMLFPIGRRKWMPLLCLMLVMIIAGAVTGCGGSSKAGPSAPPAPTSAPGGSYNVVVSATNGTVTHNVLMNIIVQ